MIDTEVLVSSVNQSIFVTSVPETGLGHKKTVVKMKTHHKTSAFTATLAIILLVGCTNSNPVETTNDAEENPEDARPAAIPAAMMGRYYGSPYMEDYLPNAAKRIPILSEADQSEDEEEKGLPRYAEGRENSPSSYLRLLKALEEELALEAMAREESMADEPSAAEVEPQNDVHQVDKRRRRRYGFWVTAINKMNNGHLKGFLSKHKNIYNVYKRQAPEKKWVRWTPRRQGRDGVKWLPRSAF